MRRHAYLISASAAYLKFLHHKRQILSIWEFQRERQHWIDKFASAHDFPKLVKDGCYGGKRTSESGHLVVCSIAIFARHACDRMAAVRLTSRRNGLEEPLRDPKLRFCLMAEIARRDFQRPPASSQAAMVARSSPVISVTLPGGIALDHAALRPISRALRWM